MKSLFTISSKENGIGKVQFSWDRTGNNLAICGSTRRCRIYSRQGNLTHQFSLEHPGTILGLGWDEDGDILGIIQEKNSQIILWDSNSKKIEKMETNCKELTFLKWSKEGPQLGIGTSKGTLLIYNKRTGKLSSVKGKVSRRIYDGCWNVADNYIAICDDRTISINNVKCDTIEDKTVKGEPCGMKFISIKHQDVVKSSDTTLCVNVGGKSLWMYDYNKSNDSQQLKDDLGGGGSRPLELTFQEKYGKIVDFKNFGDGYLLVGFESGYVIIISTHIEEIGNEVNTSKIHDNILYSINYSSKVKKGVSIGDSCVTSFDLSDLSQFDKKKQTDSIEFENEYNSLNRVEWTDDGQILTVSSDKGNVYSIITSLPVINDYYDTRVCFMTSLRQVCIKDITSDTVLSKFNIEIEPSFIALGKSHCAVGMNNRIWYYKVLQDGKGENNGKALLLGDKEYLGTVEEVKIGLQYVAVLCMGKIVIQLIELDQKRKDKTEKYFPENDEDEISSFCMTELFLIYSTKRGSITYFSLVDWKFVNSYRNDVGIVNIFANSLGTSLVFIDDTHSSYLYNPINNDCLPIEHFSGSVDKIIWDLNDNTVFITSDKNSFVTYTCSRNTIKGSEVKPITQVKNRTLLQKTKRPDGVTPIILINGKCIVHLSNGYLASITLDTHNMIGKRVDNKNLQLNKLYQLMKLKKFEESYLLADEINSNKLWEYLADKCLFYLEIDIATRIYRKLQDCARVYALESFKHIDELNLVLGYIAMIRKDFAEAEQRFLQSSQQIKALEMRRDLMHWDSAIKLAENFDQKQIPFISREYAQQLELQGDVESAFSYYEKALEGNTKDHKHVSICNEGIARTQIRRGYHKIGYDIAFNSGNIKLCKDCAQLFEDLKLFDDASNLYIKAQMYEKAAFIDLFTKNYTRVEKLLAKLDNPKLLIQYAKAMENEKKYTKSVQAYEKAGDLFSVVRVCLIMGNISKAIDIVKNIKSIEGAEIIANFCLKNRKYKRAIEFLVLAKRFNEAFDIAKLHNEMTILSKIIKHSGSKTEFIKIAEWFERNSQFEEAGDYYVKCDKFEKSLKCYFKCDEKRIEELIEICGKPNQSTRLITKVLSFIMGEIDGKPKDLKYLFKLYMMLKNYKQAVQTALMISNQEREFGNYLVAKRYLFEIHQELVNMKIHVPRDIISNLMILQCYIIVKDLAKLKELQLSARILLKVVDSLSKFPKHQVPILLSTVLYCTKANLKQQAFECALKLVRSKEHRKNLTKKWSDRLVKLVRRHKKESARENNEKIDILQLQSKCPFCDHLVGKYESGCTNCKNSIPVCIVTGQHMVKNDWSFCPNCNFNSLYSKFSKLLELNNSICPMCEKKINSDQVSVIKDVGPILKKIIDDANAPEDFGDDDGGINGNDDEDDDEDGDEESDNEEENHMDFGNL